MTRSRKLLLALLLIAFAAAVNIGLIGLMQSYRLSGWLTYPLVLIGNLLALVVIHPRFIPLSAQAWMQSTGSALYGTLIATACVCGLVMNGLENYRVWSSRLKEVSALRELEIGHQEENYYRLTYTGIDKERGREEIRYIDKSYDGEFLYPMIEAKKSDLEPWVFTHYFDYKREFDLIERMKQDLPDSGTIIVQIAEPSLPWIDPEIAHQSAKANGYRDAVVLQPITLPGKGSVNRMLYLITLGMYVLVVAFVGSRLLKRHNL